MHLIYDALFILAGFIWGDWKNWGVYYPTILFLIIGNLLKSFLLFNYDMWSFQETIFLENILRNHTIIALLKMFLCYPATVLIYLGHFPKSRAKQIAWIAFWVSIYLGIELVNLHLNLLNHYHGWNMWWSLTFDIFLFIVLWIHFKRPLLAWGLSLIWILFLWNVFNIPIDNLK